VVTRCCVVTVDGAEHRAVRYDEKASAEVPDLAGLREPHRPGFIAQPPQQCVRVDQQAAHTEIRRSSGVSSKSSASATGPSGLPRINPVARSDELAARP
jgi:hypothetical protein